MQPEHKAQCLGWMRQREEEQLIPNLLGLRMEVWASAAGVQLSLEDKTCGLQDRMKQGEV